MSALTGAAVRQLNATADRFAAEHHLPDVSWGLVVDGSVVVGRASDTVYRIASMTKSFTAAAVLSLRDEGVLHLDTAIADIAPELAAVRPAAADAPPVTVRHLLSMASGLATDDPWADRHLDITDDALDTHVGDGLVFAAVPGTAFEYSNLGYGLIGRVVLRATGRRVQDHVSERLLEPLRLTNTGWLQPPHERWARPHRSVDGAVVPDGATPLGDGGIAPMGGLWSTVADLARWMAFLGDAFPAGAASEPETGTGAVLARSTRREMQQIHNWAGVRTMGGRQSPTGYGFGLLVSDDPRLGRVVTHSGGLPGYGSNMRWLPGRRIGAVALANTTYAPMSELTTALLDVAAEHEMVPAHPVPAVDPEMRALVERLVALLDMWGDPATATDPADPALVDGVFADNVSLDDPYDRRAAAARALRDECGAAFEIVGMAANTATSVVVSLRHVSGTPVRLRVMAAPVRPLRVQAYDRL